MLNGFQCFHNEKRPPQVKNYLGMPERQKLSVLILSYFSLPPKRYVLHLFICSRALLDQKLSVSFLSVLLFSICQKWSYYVKMRWFNCCIFLNNIIIVNSDPYKNKICFYLHLATHWSKLEKKTEFIVYLVPYNTYLLEGEVAQK